MCGAHRDQDGVFERREVAALAELEFLLEIASKIVVPRELDRWRKRSVSLHEYFARGFSAPRASCYLCEKLKRAFARAKVSQCFAICFLTRHGVCIHAAHHSFGKNLRHG